MRTSTVIPTYLQRNPPKDTSAEEHHTASESGHWYQQVQWIVDELERSIAELSSRLDEYRKRSARGNLNAYQSNFVQGYPSSQCLTSSPLHNLVPLTATATSKAG